MTHTSEAALEWLETLPKKDRKLPKGFKTKWTNALRSGDYAKTKGELCKVEESGKVGYCCLGVAGRVLGNTNEQLDAAFLSEEHNKKQKVPALLIGANPVTKYLSDLNDDDKRKAGFVTIAKWIDKHL